MEYQRIDPKAIKSFRINAAIDLLIVLAIEIPATAVILITGWDSPWRWVIFAGMALVTLACLINLTVIPPFEYKQWGYMLQDDKVVVRHGIFIEKETVIPVIRIQNITVSQGPIDRKLGLHRVHMFLASGSFEIIGLDKETAERISENLKNGLYRRLSEKGDEL